MPDSRSLSRRRLFGSAAAAGLAATLVPGADEPPAKAVGAKAADVASIEAILAALYDVISGAKGQERDWDRFRGLFATGARLIPCLPKNSKGKAATRVFTVDEFAERAAASSRQRGFYEKEVARKLERFGHIAQVFSTYESRERPDAEPFARGINSIQLFWDETRWWVVTIFWDAATPERPIPPEYLPRP
jgi:hypothetical protein